MSGTDDLKNLLDRLKDEVGPLPPEEQPEPRSAQPPPRPQGRPGFSRPASFYRPEGQREPSAASGVNLAWSENKEAMLFGVLASLILSMVGVLAGLDYLVLVGVVFFILFSLVMFLALFGYYLSFRRRSLPDQGLAERLDAISRKVEALSSRAAGAGASPVAMGKERDRELEHKVEELRVLVKSLSRAVEQNNK